MRRTFSYGFEVRGFGDVEGTYTADEGEIDTIELPDGEEVIASIAGSVKHSDPLCKALGDAIYAKLRACDAVRFDQLPQTVTIEDARRYAPALA